MVDLIHDLVTFDSLLFIYVEESRNILKVGKGSREINKIDKFIGLLHTTNGEGNNGLEGQVHDHHGVSESHQ